MTSETRFATNRGQRIAYDVTGEGPAVVLQHGLFGNRGGMHDTGYVGALSDAYRVICIDSVGHGESDKPADPTPYARAARAGDVADVLDAEGIDRAHFIGYSMGGWIGSGMLQFEPHRLLSAVIGGWFPVAGVVRDPAAFDGVLQQLKANAPQMAPWITDEVVAAARACWSAITEVEGAEAALRAAKVPLLLWAGREDPSFAPMRHLAGEAEGIALLEIPGNHMAAAFVHVAGSSAGLRNFLDRIERQTGRS